jgi:hypothetical protein
MPASIHRRVPRYAVNHRWGAMGAMPTALSGHVFRAIGMPTETCSVLPTFFVAKSSALDEQKEFGNAAPECDPTWNSIPFASQEST